MIVFEEVTKDYPNGTLALSGVSFRVDENDFVFLVGPSGAGKTTVLKMMLRQIKPSSGTILINEEDITNKKFKKTVDLRRLIGMVFQDYKILLEKNVFENVAISLRVVGTPSAEITEKVHEALRLVGLKNKHLMFPLQLSAGEVQRVAIARAIIGNRNRTQVTIHIFI